ncbi:hypothetical protein Avbf_19114 [Armadillidium vulgare]|nr:hypothetical protein Avbf_19114 [Armadillidium vulgare]
MCSETSRHTPWKRISFFWCCIRGGHYVSLYSRDTYSWISTL